MLLLRRLRRWARRCLAPPARPTVALPPPPSAVGPRAAPPLHPAPPPRYAPSWYEIGGGGRLGATSFAALARDPAWFRALGFTHVVSFQPGLNGAALEASGLTPLDPAGELLVRDFAPPTQHQLARFWALVDALPERARVLVHCTAGVGRSGTYLAAYVVARYGLPAAVAIAHVRAAAAAHCRAVGACRAVETEAQEAAVYAFAGEGPPARAPPPEHVFRQP